MLMLFFFFFFCLHFSCSRSLLQLICLAPAAAAMAPGPVFRCLVRAWFVSLLCGWIFLLVGGEQQKAPSLLLLIPAFTVSFALPNSLGF